MTKRIIPLALLICMVSVMMAQKPGTVQLAPQLDPANAGRQMLACPPGATPDAGTTMQSLFASAQSDDVRYLCWQDSLNILHDLNSDFSGDPDASTQPGIGYIFYSCAPTIDGPTIADVETDPCLILNPPPNTGTLGANFWVYTDDSDPSGTTFFWNGLNAGVSLQDFFNGGDPIEIFFAPVTIDNFGDPSFEVDGDGDTGGCIDVNTADAFSVVYLNEIVASTPSLTSGGNGCTREFTVSGGLPEFDGSFYSLDISLASDPTVKAYIDPPFEHDSTVVFTVDIPGTYTVTIDDGVSCGLTFNVDMSGCVPVNLRLSNGCVQPNDQFCINVLAYDFVNVTTNQYTLRWDETVLQYQQLIPGAQSPPDLIFNPNPPQPGTMIVSWRNTNNMGVEIPTTFADSTVLFQVCFTAIGGLNTNSELTFSDLPPLEIEFTGTDGFRNGFDGTPGMITISDCSMVIDIVTCSGRPNPADPNAGGGNITVTASGGTPPYTYTWSQNGNPGNNGSGNIGTSGGSSTVSDLPPGTYTIVVDDNGGDSQTFTVTIANADPIFVNAQKEDPTCPGDTDGRAWVSTFGGVGPYSIEWSNGAMDIDTIRNLGAGTYRVTVTDNNGCSSEGLVNLGNFSITIASENVNHVSCNGNGADGSIMVQATGGTVNTPADYMYAWSNGFNSNTITNLTPGNYNLIVTDLNNCSAQFTYTIDDGDRPTIISFDSTSVQCFSDMNGSLTVNVMEANAPIVEYNWTYPDMSMITTTTNTINGLGAGQYIVTAVASDGCSVTDTVSLFAPGPLQIENTTLTSPTCVGEENGTIAIQVSGGTPPYTSRWSTGDVRTGTVLSGLVGDSTYMVTIVDGNGCDSITVDIFLNDPPGIDIVFTPNSIQSTSCSDALSCDGAATAIASGGTAGNNSYDFSWESNETTMGATTSTATQLCAGWNTLTVTDGLCPGIDSVFIESPDPLGFDLTQTGTIPPSCNDGNDGEAFVTASGGTPGYSYLWDTGDMTDRITGQVAGIYRVTITDFNDCSFEGSLEITEPDLLIAQLDTAQTNDVRCNNESNGQISINPTGGTLPYTYSWANNVSTSNTAANLGAGTYAVTVTDANGCQDSLSYTLDEPEPLAFVIPVIEEPLCFDFPTLITVDTAFGGAGIPYTFSVDNGPNLRLGFGANVKAGSHLVTVFDANGCSVDTMVTINQPAPVSVALGEDREVQLGDSIIITANIFSGVGVDSVIWSPTDSLQCFTPNCHSVILRPINTTLYNLTVVDNNGCIGTDDIIIEIDRNRNVFIPNIFTPNEDGRNDRFKPFTGVGVERVRYMRVYDRWGELVYSEDDFVPNNDDGSEGWDGTLNGRKMNDAVFVYLMEIEFVDGVVLLYRGDVTLLR